MGNELKNKYGTDEERVSVLEVFYAGAEETETGMRIKFKTEIAVPDDDGHQSNEDHILNAIFCDSLATSLEDTAKHLRERAVKLKTAVEKDLQNDGKAEELT